MHWRIPILHLAAYFVATTACAQTNSLFVSGNVMTGFTWRAAASAGNGTSGSCSVIPNQVQYFLAPFWTDQTASTYTLSLSYPSYQAGFVYIYRDRFDPQDPCAGIIAFGFAPVANLTQITLDANRQYVFVTSEDVLFGGGGWFQATISGPQGSRISQGTLLPSMNSQLVMISLYAGGTQSWSLDAGPANAGRIYLVLGSVSGSSPGFPLPGGLVLPLNYDWWFNHTLSLPNVPPLLGSLGQLDSAGRANAAGLDVPAGLPAAIAGSVVHHAFIALDPSIGAITFVSNPVPLYFTL